MTQWGRPFTAKGLWELVPRAVRRRRAASLQRARPAQGGRVASGRVGATVNQLMAIFDWDTPAQAKVYTDAADRKRLVEQAMRSWPADQNENARCPTLRVQQCPTSTRSRG